MHIQSKLGERTTNFNANQSILALNSGGLSGNISQIGNQRPSCLTSNYFLFIIFESFQKNYNRLINPNFLRQSTLKQGIVHSIYDQDIILNIVKN